MTSIPDLLTQTRQQLLAVALQRGLTVRPHLQHDELTAEIIKDMLEKGEGVTTDGILTLLPEGFGFVRMLSRNYASTVVDAYVSANQIRSLNLQFGQRIRGSIRAPRGTEQAFALIHVDFVMDHSPDELLQVVSFSSRTKALSSRPITFCAPIKAADMQTSACSDEANLAAMQTLAPICFGNRVLLHTPAKWPSARFLSLAAKALDTHHPKSDVTVCLLDQRPEDIAAAQTLLKESDASLVSTEFAAPPERHVQVAEHALYQCMRQVEQGHDVILLIDSLTALTRARSRSTPPSGSWIQPGLNAKSIMIAKELFASAQQFSEGGSLTVIAAVTNGAPGSIDEAIQEELTPFTNSDVVVAKDCPEMSAQILPFDVVATRTRREDHKQSQEQQVQMEALRETLNTLPRDERAHRLHQFSAS